MKSIIDFYSINSFYKGRVMEVLNDGRIIAEIPDIILSKPSTDILIENVSSNNIKNSDDLNLEGKLHTVNGIICKPLYINSSLSLPIVNDTVFIIFFDKAPKKVYYINISNDCSERYRTKKYEIIEKGEDKLEVRIGGNSIKIDGESIELTGNVIINGKKIGGGDNVSSEEV